MTTNPNHVQSLFDKNYDARKQARLEAQIRAQAAIDRADPVTVSHRGLLTDKDRAAYIKALSFHEATKTCPNAFITLVFNAKEMSRENAHKKLKAFWTSVNDIAFGKGWQVRKDIAPAWFIAEHTTSNYHFHGLARFTKAFEKHLAVTAHRVNDEETNTTKVILRSPRIATLWEDCAPAGSIEMRRIDDLQKAIQYVLKDIKTIHDTSRIAVSPRFE